MTIDLLEQKTVVHNFIGLRQVRFQRYSPQFWLNQAVLLLKQWSRLRLTSLKLSFKYHLWKPQKLRLIYWSKRPLFTIFCGFRKVRFQRYSPQFRLNQGVFPTQTMITTSSNIVETFVLIPFLEASEMTIDLLEQKTVVHNFLLVRKNTFPTLQSPAQMESCRSSTQTMITTFPNIVETFA